MRRVLHNLVRTATLLVLVTGAGDSFVENDARAQSASGGGFNPGLNLAPIPKYTNPYLPTLEPERDFRKASDWGWLVLGAASGFVGHELGHVVADFMTLHHPTFHTTKTGPFYFFAIQPCCGHLSNAEAYFIASAGLVVNDLSSELILQVSPKIRGRHAPFMKGVLLVDVGLEIGYAVSGFVQSAHPKGFPDQSDVGAMSRALGVAPWKVGLTVLAPALIDVYRYFSPSTRWAPWVSIQSKMLMAGLVLPLL